MTTSSRRTRTRTPERPVGREAVVAAVLTAAAELFAERGPAATSIRDIAARSGVNHGLVYRHLGAKENLVAAVLEHLSQEVAAAAEADPMAPAVDEAVDRHLRVIARAIL